MGIRKTKVGKRAPNSRKWIVTRRLTVDERKGNLPYVVCWISLNGLPTINHFNSLPEAHRQADHLKSLGRDPAILVDVTQCEIGEAHVA